MTAFQDTSTEQATQAARAASAAQAAPGAVSAGRAGAQSDLAASLARLRRRANLVVTQRWLAVAGGVMLPLGAVLIIAGWYGSAHTTLPWEQTPYVISGGLLGLALVVAGASFYFGYWLTRLVGGERELLDVLTRIEGRLQAAEAGGSGASTTNTSSTRGVVSGAGAALVATRSGSLFHRPDCQVVAGRAPTELRAVDVAAPGMSACKLCAPLDV
jgi:hypothetical protein